MHTSRLMISDHIVRSDGGHQYVNEPEVADARADDDYGMFSASKSGIATDDRPLLNVKSGICNRIELYNMVKSGISSESLSKRTDQMMAVFVRNSRMRTIVTSKCSVERHESEYAAREPNA